MGAVPAGIGDGYAAHGLGPRLSGSGCPQPEHTMMDAPLRVATCVGRGVGQEHNVVVDDSCTGFAPL